MSISVNRAVAAILFAQVAAGVAHAQTAPLEEVVVTAQKRAGNLQDTPIAISAVTGDAIEKLNIDDIGAIAAANPSLVYSEAGGEAQLYIRGIGSNIFNVGADQSVATHIDGVYTGRANMGLTQFLDIDRVEILRGPQGTLYGRNATGGAINIISRAPTDEFEGYVSGLVGSFDRIDVRGAVSGPITENLSGRLAVRRLKDDGYTEDRDPIDYERLEINNPDKIGGVTWRSRRKDRADVLLDETMVIQGSFYMMHREHWNSIGPLDESNYGPFTQEGIEIALKTWLGGGKVMVEKQAWYAHKHRSFGRVVSPRGVDVRRGNAYSRDYWLNNRWEGRKHDLAWLIQRFGL
jgi:outer membrane receptor protein involved in Fe transport